MPYFGDYGASSALGSPGARFGVWPEQDSTTWRGPSTGPGSWMSQTLNPRKFQVR